MDNPPPVANLQSESDIADDKWERLSKFKSHPLLAVIIRSCSFFGVDRSNAEAGSINLRITRQKVDFADPCSPCTIRIGKGPSGLRLNNKNPTTRIKSSSLILMNLASSSIVPPLSGIGKRSKLLGRINLTGELSMVLHPPAEISTTPHLSSPKSRYICPFFFASLIKTGCSSPSYLACACRADIKSLAS